MLRKICVVLGILFILYCLGIGGYQGFGSSFHLIWLVAGAVLLVLAKCIQYEVWDKLPGAVQKVFIIFTVIGLIAFVFVEGFVISGFFQKGTKGLDYIVVLGAHVRASGPSRVLAMRLDKAIAYATENENTTLIVSGGQGSNEPMSEAQAMFDYLVEKGIQEERILLEDKSTNTYENLTFSRRLLEVHFQEQQSREEKPEPSVGIVTNNFHVYRAVQLAESNNYENVCGIAARSDFFLQANNMVREFCGVMKDLIMGHMKLF